MVSFKPRASRFQLDQGPSLGVAAGTLLFGHSLGFDREGVNECLRPLRDSPSLLAVE